VRRWQSLDFVVGYEIRRSNNPDQMCEQCKQLAGKYPKSFIWAITLQKLPYLQHKIGFNDYRSIRTE
jgi:hypothetical protein